MVIKVLSIIFLLLVSLFGVYLMKIQSSIIKEDWFKNLKYESKISITSIIKSSWKTSIILLSIAVAILLIIVSTFIGNGNKYDSIISILGSLTSVIVLLALIKNNKKYTENISKIDK